MSQPFNEGDVVRIKGNDHLGLHEVESCEWFERTHDGVKPYWLVKTSQIREPIDWSTIPKGATGLIAHCGWSGSADHLELAK